MNNYRVRTEPLCGLDWYRQHLYDHTEAEIQALTMEVSIDERRVFSIRQSHKRGIVGEVIKAQRKES